MNDERIAHDERLATARLSDDLTLKKHRCDCDELIAAGISALRESSAATPLIRLQTSMDVSEWSAALERTRQIAHRLVHKDKWRLEDPQIESLAREALKYFLVPNCPHCKGRQFEEVKGTGRLGSRVCRVCKGTGRRPFQKEKSVWLRAIVATIENEASDVNSVIRKVMR